MCVGVKVRKRLIRNGDGRFRRPFETNVETNGVVASAVAAKRTIRANTKPIAVVYDQRRPHRRLALTDNNNNTCYGRLICVDSSVLGRRERAKLRVCPRLTVIIVLPPRRPK